MRENLGFSVMLGMLAGNEDSVNAFQDAVGKIISDLRLGEDDILHFVFEDDAKLKLFDDGQSCCEHRYMHTDDDLDYFIGTKFLDAEIRSAPNEPDEWGEHEVQFLIVSTSGGEFTMVTHNEHNGYYGGFLIRAAIED